MRFAVLAVFVVSYSTYFEVLADPAVTVHIRTVRASDFCTSGKRTRMRIDPKLEDIRSKLEKLQYRSYKLLSTSSAEMKLKNRETVSLGNGQTLTIRPLYIKPERAGLWLKWNDRSGDGILDTRMHFAPGESVITGTENSADSGIILAIDVEPKG